MVAMRTATMLPVLALLLLPSSAASAQPTPDGSALTDVERGLEGGATDSIEEHVSRGSRVAAAFTALTGEAISPLFGVTARSLWVYWTTPSELRSALPTLLPAVRVGAVGRAAADAVLQGDNR